MMTPVTPITANRGVAPAGVVLRMVARAFTHIDLQVSLQFRVFGEMSG